MRWANGSKLSRKHCEFERHVISIQRFFVSAATLY
jgi:hypothetical protein